MFNRLTLMGRLTRDVELITTTGGTVIGSTAIAVSEKRKEVERVVFIDVTLFSRTAEVVAEYFKKGDAILLDGALAQDNWEKDGQKRSKLKMVANGFTFIPSTREYDPAGVVAAKPDPDQFDAPVAGEEGVPF